jgi:hypothetical protein
MRSKSRSLSRTPLPGVGSAMPVKPLLCYAPDRDPAAYI